MKKFAVFDIDGTVYRWSLFLELTHELTKKGLLPDEYVKLHNSRLQAWQERQTEDAFNRYATDVSDAYNQAITGLAVDDVEKVARQLVSKKKAHTYRYTRQLIAKLKKEGYFLIAISGSQLELVEPFVKEYGFDAWVGRLDHKVNGKYSGKITKTYKDKHLHLEKLIKKHDLTLSGSFAVGDGEGDISMLAMVENPIAFNPEMELFAHAKKNGWSVIIERKNMIYKLQKGDDDVYILAETN